MGAMSAEVIGQHMPAVPSLDDLTAMMAADPHGHRYETSPEGVLSVTPPPDDGYQVRATMPLSWVLNTSPDDHLSP
jgi:hypothetical protein